MLNGPFIFNEEERKKIERGTLGIKNKMAISKYLSRVTLNLNKLNASIERHKIDKWVLADVLQWIECWPVKQRVTSLIPSQGTCLGCKPDPQWRTCENQPHIDVSVLLFLPPFPSTYK